MATKKPIPKANKAAPKKDAAVCDKQGKNKIGRNIPNKGAGRPKGSPNKATKAAKEIIVALVDKLAPDVESWMMEMEPKDRMTAYIKLLDFVMPKLAAVPAPDPDDEPVEKTAFVDSDGKG